MSAENPYSPSRVSASPVSSSSSGINIPSHADSLLESLRKGSPVIPFVVSGVIALAVLLIGMVAVVVIAKENGNAGGDQGAMGFALVMLLMLIPLIFMIIYEVRLIYRLAAVMHLDEKEPSMTPVVSTVLCLIPLVNIVGLILFVLKIREHYPRVVAQNDLTDAPEINGTYLIICIVCMFLGWIPFLGLIFSMAQLVLGILLLIQFHKTLNYFAARV
jgi:hypothetical protein